MRKASSDYLGDRKFVEIQEKYVQVFRDLISFDVDVNFVDGGNDSDGDDDNDDSNENNDEELNDDNDDGNENNDEELNDEDNLDLVGEIIDAITDEYLYGDLFGDNYVKMKVLNQGLPTPDRMPTCASNASASPGKRIVKPSSYLLSPENVFETNSGGLSVNLETLAPGLWIDANVIDCWGAILNHEEKFRDAKSKLRHFFPPIVFRIAIEITLDLPTVEPEDSLRMGDEHLDTISETESDEFIKSSVVNIVPKPSESEDDAEYDVPAYDDFTTFSSIIFDVDDDFSSSDIESFSDKDIPKEIYLNPLFDEEIISIKIDLHYFNVESDLIESLLNHDSSIISSSKIDSLLDEFAGELILLKSI
nr:hypothetical protein [Tanacetum cinerariifolium]